jgi:signal peptidase II
VAELTDGRAAYRYAWGRLTGFGFAVALAACALDQAVKFYLLLGLDLGNRQPVALTRFFELVLTWNTGISYGLLAGQGPLGQWALFGFKVVAVVFLWAWLSRTSTRLTAAALGLIIGGAVGNALDRLHWPGVLDFALFHIDAAAWTFRWYVFNMADVAIVAGVIGLLYESISGGNAVKAP